MSLGATAEGGSLTSIYRILGSARSKREWGCGMAARLRATIGGPGVIVKQPMTFESLCFSRADGRMRVGYCMGGVLGRGWKVLVTKPMGEPRFG